MAGITPSPRPMQRAAKAILNDDHGLGPYRPEVGDIVIAFHVFPRAGMADHAPAQRSTRPKFRPCIVIATSGADIALVPVSSSPERHGRHLAITEPSELVALGLAPDRTAYGKVLETTVYDTPHPLLRPTLDADGNPAWTCGRAPAYLVSQLRNELARQKAHGRFDKPRKRRARDVPAGLVADMEQTARKALLLHRLNTPRAEAAAPETPDCRAARIRARAEQMALARGRVSDTPKARRAQPSRDI